MNHIYKTILILILLLCFYSLSIYSMNEFTDIGTVPDHIVNIPTNQQNNNINGWLKAINVLQEIGKYRPCCSKYSLEKIGKYTAPKWPSERLKWVYNTRVGKFIGKAFPVINLGLSAYSTYLSCVETSELFHQGDYLQGSIYTILTAMNILGILYPMIGFSSDILKLFNSHKVRVLPTNQINSNKVYPVHIINEILPPGESFEIELFPISNNIKIDILKSYQIYTTIPYYAYILTKGHPLHFPLRWGLFSAYIICLVVKPKLSPITGWFLSILNVVHANYLVQNYHNYNLTHFSQSYWKQIVYPVIVGSILFHADNAINPWIRSISQKSLIKEVVGYINYRRLLWIPLSHQLFPYHLVVANASNENIIYPHIPETVVAPYRLFHDILYSSQSENKTLLNKE